MESWTIESFAASGYAIGYVALLVVTFLIANTLGLLAGARVAVIEERGVGRALGSTIVILALGLLIWWAVGLIHPAVGIATAGFATVVVVRVAYRSSWGQALVAHAIGLTVGIWGVIALGMWLAGPQAAVQPIAPEPHPPQVGGGAPPRVIAADTPTLDARKADAATSATSDTGTAESAVP
jgi:hypothetical protein